MWHHHVYSVEVNPDRGVRRIPDLPDRFPGDLPISTHLADNGLSTIPLPASDECFSKGHLILNLIDVPKNKSEQNPRTAASLAEV